MALAALAAVPLEGITPVAVPALAGVAMGVSLIAVGICRCRRDSRLFVVYEM